MNRRSGLGRGLGALIPGDVGTDGESAFRELPLSSISPNTLQPRRHFDEASLVSLTESIKALGVIQPLIVRARDDDTYELVAGERRWRAAKRAGLPTVPVIVRSLADVGSLEQALVENLHREDLNPLEEAAAYRQLMDDFHLTQEAVAERVGKSRSAVANTLRLFQLSPAVQKVVASAELSAGHPRALLGVDDRRQQEQLARRVINEQLSVRALERLLKDGAGDAVRSQLRGGEPARDDGGDGESSTAHRSIRPAALLELEQLLAEYLATRVGVTMNERRGRISIDFADLADLERLYRRIAHLDERPGSAPDDH